MSQNLRGDYLRARRELIHPETVGLDQAATDYLLGLAASALAPGRAWLCPEASPAAEVPRDAVRARRELAR